MARVAIGNYYHDTVQGTDKGPEDRRPNSVLPQLTMVFCVGYLTLQSFQHLETKLGVTAPALAVAASSEWIWNIMTVGTMNDRGSCQWRKRERLKGWVYQYWCFWWVQPLREAISPSHDSANNDSQSFRPAYTSKHGQVWPCWRAQAGYESGMVCTWMRLGKASPRLLSRVGTSQGFADIWIWHRCPWVPSQPCPFTEDI